MKTGTLILGIALTAAAGSAVWLLTENQRLRTELEGLEVASGPVRKGIAAAGSRVAASQEKTGGAPAAAAGGGTKTPAAKSGQNPLSVRNGLVQEAAGAALTFTDNRDGTFTVSSQDGSWSKVMTAQQMSEFGNSIGSALQEAVTKLPGGPSWSPGRAAGPPDTAEHGDYHTAWASQSPDGGKEWLQLKYANSVEIGEINIHETYNPGALSKVSAIMPDGSEKVIWEGTEDAESGVVERAVKVPPGIRSDQIRVEMDTSRVPGWNEIDAVELVGRDGSRQWASESTASSYFGQGQRTGLSVEMFSGSSLESLPAAERENLSLLHLGE